MQRQTDRQGYLHVRYVLHQQKNKNHRSKHHVINARNCTTVRTKQDHPHPTTWARKSRRINTGITSSTLRAFQDCPRAAGGYETPPRLPPSQGNCRKAYRSDHGFLGAPSRGMLARRCRRARGETDDRRRHSWCER